MSATIEKNKVHVDPLESGVVIMDEIKVWDEYSSEIGLRKVVISLEKDIECVAKLTFCESSERYSYRVGFREKGIKYYPSNGKMYHGIKEVYSDSGEIFKGLSAKEFAMVYKQRTIDAFNMLTKRIDAAEHYRNLSDEDWGKYTSHKYGRL